MIRYVLRIPTDLHASLVAWAKEEQRSLNGLIIYLLTGLARERRERADKEEAA